jgi:hypothetical protein
MYCDYRIGPIENGDGAEPLFLVVEVEVDVALYEVRIARYVAFHDSGRQINPMIVDGQIMGGIAHGIGNALYLDRNATGRTALSGDALADKSVGGERRGEGGNDSGRRRDHLRRRGCPVAVFHSAFEHAGDAGNAVRGHRRGPFQVARLHIGPCDEEAATDARLRRLRDRAPA